MFKGIVYVWQLEPIVCLKSHIINLWKKVVAFVRHCRKSGAVLMSTQENNLQLEHTVLETLLSVTHLVFGSGKIICMIVYMEL